MFAPLPRTPRLSRNFNKWRTMGPVVHIEAIALVSVLAMFARYRRIRYHAVAAIVMPVDANCHTTMAGFWPTRPLVQLLLNYCNRIKSLSIHQCSVPIIIMTLISLRRRYTSSPLSFNGAWVFQQNFPASAAPNKGNSYCHRHSRARSLILAQETAGIGLA